MRTRSDTLVTAFAAQSQRAGTSTVSGMLLMPMEGVGCFAS